jgi:hypothetical protein
VIGEFGKNLYILILAENTPKDDWMSFALWLSLRRQLPDCVPFLLINRFKKTILPVFSWVERVDGIIPVKTMDLNSVHYTLTPNKLAIKIADEVKIGWNNGVFHDCFYEYPQKLSNEPFPDLIFPGVDGGRVWSIWREALAIYPLLAF